MPAIPIDAGPLTLHVKEDAARGFWGHGIRNAYAKKLERSDFILHADDDDIYLPGAFDSLRALCRNPKALYIAKFKRNNVLYPFQTYIKEGEIGTPCGIIPFDLNAAGVWLERRGGDGKFYEAIAKRARFIKFLDLVIYSCDSERL